MQLKRDRDPLVLLDAAVIVRFEKAHLVGLIHGDLLEVEARGIDMRAGDHSALAQGLFADNGQHESLAAVVLVYLHTGDKLHTGSVLDKAQLLGLRNGVCDSLALHAGVVKKVHVACAVLLDLYALGSVNEIVTVLLFIKKLFTKFAHLLSTSKNKFRQQSENSSLVPLFCRM